MGLVDGLRGNAAHLLPFRPASYPVLGHLKPARMGAGR
jgi:hypothetical protein